MSMDPTFDLAPPDDARGVADLLASPESVFCFAPPAEPGGVLFAAPEAGVLAADRAVVVLRAAGLVVAEDLSALADSGFVDLVAEVADVGVDFDVAGAGAAFLAADGGWWLAVGATFAAVFAAGLCVAAAPPLGAAAFAGAATALESVF